MTGKARARLIVLDRDGVINADSAEYIRTPDEWLPLPGALEAIARLNAAGYRVSVATNQSGIGRGLFDVATLEAIHDTMLRAIARAGGEIFGIYYCPHKPGDGCRCRKPEPGLLLQAAADAGVEPAELVFVGDKPSDVAAARNAGARPLLVGAAAAAGHDHAGVERAADLAAVAELLIAEAERDA